MRKTDQTTIFGCCCCSDDVVVFFLPIFPFMHARTYTHSCARGEKTPFIIKPFHCYNNDSIIVVAVVSGAFSKVVILLLPRFRGRSFGCHIYVHFNTFFLLLYTILESLSLWCLCARDVCVVPFYFHPAISMSKTNRQQTHCGSCG